MINLDSSIERKFIILCSSNISSSSLWNINFSFSLFLGSFGLILFKGILFAVVWNVFFDSKGQRYVSILDYFFQDTYLYFVWVENWLFFFWIFLKRIQNKLLQRCRIKLIQRKQFSIEIAKKNLSINFNCSDKRKIKYETLFPIIQ